MLLDYEESESLQLKQYPWKVNIKDFSFSKVENLSSF